MKRKEIIILSLCVIIGFALRFYTFDKRSLWIDEIHTFNDSKEGLQGQLIFYEEEPTYLHPPLFFVLTHFFFPFTKPERDLRVIPLIFGTLSIPIIYFLSRSFSPNIAIPCTLSLTFMAYHISLSQDGRCYSLLMFVGMLALYFFMKHLQTSKKGFLLPVALLFATLFHTSYSAIPFIALSQVLWFYSTRENDKRPILSSFLLLNGLILLLCLPWIIFVGTNYKGQMLMHPFETDLGSFWDTVFGVLHDWVSNIPLMIISVTLLVLFPIFSKYRRNTFILLSAFVLPVAGLQIYCNLLNVTHFITSRYFINFLPLFFVTIYLSLDAIERQSDKLRKVIRLKLLFTILFVASNLLILPLYYRFEKQDFRGLTNYLKAHLREGDRILDFDLASTPGILHYFGTFPEARHYVIPFQRISEKEIELRKSFSYNTKTFTIYFSNIGSDKYTKDRTRLWIVTGKNGAEKIMGNPACVLKGYFASFSFFRRFSSDASIYLFLWNPNSPGEKGIDLPTE